MIIARLMGGMGNQMFQYAFGRFLAKKHNTQLKMDKTSLEDRTPSPNVVFRNYDLDIFNIHEDFATVEEVHSYVGKPSAQIIDKVKNRFNRYFNSKNVVEQEGNLVLPEYFEIEDDSLVIGRWQSAKFFDSIAEEIRQEFSFKNPLDSKAESLAEIIRKNTAVCLNVRRADYVNNPLYAKILGFIGVEYYNNAVEEMQQKIGKEFSLFVFSDDIEWCQENLSFDVPTTFVTHDYKGPKFQYYLHLMCLCDHFIIPNSTFAWWAAWLSNSPQKVVIAPKNWAADGSVADDDILPASWIKM